MSIADEGVFKELLAIVVNKSIGQHPRKHYGGHKRQHGARRIGVVFHILVALTQQGLSWPPQFSTCSFDLGPTPLSKSLPSLEPGNFCLLKWYTEGLK